MFEPIAVNDAREVVPNCLNRTDGSADAGAKPAEERPTLLGDPPAMFHFSRSRRKLLAFSLTFLATAGAALAQQKPAALRRFNPRERSTATPTPCIRSLGPLTAKT